MDKAYETRIVVRTGANKWKDLKTKVSYKWNISMNTGMEPLNTPSVVLVFQGQIIAQEILRNLDISDQISKILEKWEKSTQS